jgi:hypothetical protein
VRAGRRLWRTRDGGLVTDGDPAAATLAYAAGDELSAGDEQLLADPAEAGEPAAKAAPAPADKARRRTAAK